MKLVTKLFDLTAWGVLSSLNLMLSIDLLLLLVASLTGVDEIFIIATVLAAPATALLSYRMNTLTGNQLFKYIQYMFFEQWTCLNFTHEVVALSI